MDEPLIWIHGDCLDPRSPALTAHPRAPRVFVFDEELLARYRLSLKRIAFLYECLLEIPGIEIRRGEVAAELADAARETRARRIVTTASIAPRFADLRDALQRRHGLPVEALPVDPFLPLSPEEAARLDLKRFSRYWNALRARALTSE